TDCEPSCPQSYGGKEADLSHCENSCLKDCVSKTRDPLTQELAVATLPSIAAQATSFNPKSIQPEPIRFSARFPEP
ncbi:MAG: hypothetical protein J0H57_09655, partial [Rhodospirillales bacterium]|nr:hypothetical protein [Rhodospirillales bacterium]